MYQEVVKSVTPNAAAKLLLNKPYHILVYLYLIMNKLELVIECHAFALLLNKTDYLKVENSAQSSFRFSPVKCCAYLLVLQVQFLSL
jgi:hypothetical protein